MKSVFVLVRVNSDDVIIKIISSHATKVSANRAEQNYRDAATSEMYLAGFFKDIQDLFTDIIEVDFEL